MHSTLGLYVPLLQKPKIIEATLKALQDPLPRLDILGPTARVGVCADDATHNVLTPLGYTEPNEPPFGSALAVLCPD